MSQKVHKRIEQGFRGVKTIGGLRKLPMIGVSAVRDWTTWTFAAYNLIRISGIAEWRDPWQT